MSPRFSSWIYIYKECYQIFKRTVTPMMSLPINATRGFLIQAIYDVILTCSRLILNCG